MMFRKFSFIAAHQLRDLNFYPTYVKLVRDQWRTYEELREKQERILQNLILYSYRNVPYYHKLFKNLKLDPYDIKKIDDLERLPMLTKEIIKNNWNDFKPAHLKRIKYYDDVTGGTTGNPFKFRIFKFDRVLSGALLYRGWSYGGYELGDKMVFLAGSSLNIGAKSSMKTRMHEIARNIKKLSSYNMGENELVKYANIINSFKPKFIRGYASSIYLFSKWLDENNMHIYRPSAVFTTADKLHPYMRKKIESVFDCKVYDTYGLNDGGISAFECSEHAGLHIDTERSIMEVVDGNGEQLECGEGKVLSTSLYNYAMPFIRYETGDLCHVIDDVCNCGRSQKLLQNVVGRTLDFLITPEREFINGLFFDDIFDDMEDIKMYQIIQEKIDKIVINIVPQENFNENILNNIRDIIRNRSTRWYVEFNLVDKIEMTKAGKYRAIINKLDENVCS